MTRYFLANAALAAAATIAACCIASPGPASAAAGPRVDVVVNDRACEPDELSVPAGGVTFSIHNQTSRALEWEILDGVMMIDERENIGPGLVASLTTKLAPGDYQITCGFPSNPKGQLHVAALSGAPARITQVELIGPLAEYRVFASYEIDGLVDDTRRLDDALKSGDLAAARQAFSTARAHYGRLAPIAMFFPDLEGDVDTHPENRDKAMAEDSTYMGFRQLEWDLFASAKPLDGRPIATKLAADAVALQTQFETAPLTLKPTFLGVSGAIGGAAPAILDNDASGEAETALSQLAAYIEGAQKVVELFRPLIARTDKPLSVALASDFATFASVLGKYQGADGAMGLAKLSSRDREALRGVAKRLTGEVARIPSALDLE